MRFLNKAGERGLTLLGDNLYEGEIELTGGSLAASEWSFSGGRRAMRMAENASLGGGMRGGGGGGGFDETGSLFNSWDANGDLSDRDLGLSDRFERDKSLELGWQFQDGSEGFRSSGEGLSDQGGWNRPVAASSGAYPVAAAMPMPFYETKTREIAYTIAKPVYSHQFPLAILVQPARLHRLAEHVISGSPGAGAETDAAEDFRRLVGRGTGIGERPAADRRLAETCRRPGTASDRRQLRSALESPLGSSHQLGVVFADGMAHSPDRFGRPNGGELLQRP